MGNTYDQFFPVKKYKNWYINDKCKFVITIHYLKYLKALRFSLLSGMVGAVIFTIYHICLFFCN